VKCFLVFHGMVDISHFACSHDITPVHFLCSIQWKLLERKKIQDTKCTKKKVSTKLCAAAVDSFNGCFVQLLESCKTCVAVIKDYLEGKIKQFSSFFICMCCYRPCPKIMLFDHIDPKDGNSKLQNF
jgi:hypothetical protein